MNFGPATIEMSIATQARDEDADHYGETARRGVVGERLEPDRARAP